MTEDAFRFRTLLLTWPNTSWMKSRPLDGAFSSVVYNINRLFRVRPGVDRISYTHSLNLICYRPQRSCGRVMFLHLSVSHSVYGGCVSQHALRQTSQHALRQMPPQADISQHTLGQTPPQADISQHALGQTPPGQTYPGMHWGRQPPPLMATAADGTHPTGMHSCWRCWRISYHKKYTWLNLNSKIVNKRKTMKTTTKNYKIVVQIKE